MRILALALIAVTLSTMVAGAAGCGKEAAPPPTATPAPTIAPQPSPTGPPTFSTPASPTITPTPTRTPLPSPTATPVVSPTPTATATPVVSPTPSPTATPEAGDRIVTIELVASGIEFNVDEISVPQGALVAVTFRNDDVGIPHNLSVYEILPGSQTRPVFLGTTITGPGVTPYYFAAPPAAGNYFFSCDVHPDVMYGDLKVVAP